MQCKAKSKSTGVQCRRRAVKEREVCQVHGGVTPRGTAAGSFKHGRYSKDIPTRLAARYEEAAADPDLLVLREEIALLDARLGDLIKRVDTGEAGVLWEQLRKTWIEFAGARASQDADKEHEFFNQLDSLIKRGIADYAAWAEIGRVIEQRRKLVESERKRLVELQQYVTVEQMMLSMGRVLQIIRAHVTDRPTLVAIGNEMNRLVENNQGAEIIEVEKV